MKPRQQIAWPPAVVARVDSGRDAREKVRTANPELFQALTEALFERDPMGIHFESNTDEYEPEVAAIVPRLAACRSEDDTLQVIHEVFCEWFGEETAGPPDRYRQVSRDVWRLWTSRPR
jgi:hypothetical protein